MKYISTVYLNYYNSTCECTNLNQVYVAWTQPPEIPMAEPEL